MNRRRLGALACMLVGLMGPGCGSGGDAPPSGAVTAEGGDASNPASKPDGGSMPDVADAAKPADSGNGQRDAATPSNSDGGSKPMLSDAGDDAAVTGDPRWWENGSWTPLTWVPTGCEISVLEDPSVIPALQWEPLSLGNLTGAVPVIPEGWTWFGYAELADGTRFWQGRVVGEKVEEIIAASDPSGTPVFGLKGASCIPEFSSTSRGVCGHFSPGDGEDGVVACGDFRKPSVTVEIPRTGFTAASTDDLVLIGRGWAHSVYIVDVTDGTFDEAEPAPGQSLGYRKATAQGRDAFAIYAMTPPSRGAIFHRDGSSLFDWLWEVTDTRYEVVNLHATAGYLVWTETELVGETTKTGTSIYRAPWPPSGATLAPSLIRKIDLITTSHITTMAAGQLALRKQDRIEFIDIDSGSRHTVQMGDRWNASHMFLNDRSLVIRMFDSPDVSKYVSFRADLTDVLALPAD